MKTVKTIFFRIGLLLLVINIYGLFKTLRNPDIYNLEYTIKNRKNDVTIHYPEIKKQLVRKANEPEKDFAVRINKVVNDGFAHYWKAEGTDKY